MSLEDEIQDRLVADTESILQNNLDRVEKLFELHEDGTVNINGEYRDVDPENEMLIYLVAQRFAKEGNIDDEDTIATDFFYERFDRGDRTIRNDLQALREEGLVTKEGQSRHRIIVENLPNALDRIENSIEPGGDQ